MLRPFPDLVPPRVLVWIALGGATGLALARRSARRGAACGRRGCLLAVLVTSAVKVNAFYGYRPTLAAALRLPAANEINEAEALHTAPIVFGPPGVSLSTVWHGPPTMLGGGRIAHIAIPGRVSRFPVRRAWLYLPPVCLASPPAAAAGGGAGSAAARRTRGRDPGGSPPCRARPVRRCARRARFRGDRARRQRLAVREPGVPRLRLGAAETYSHRRTAGWRPTFRSTTAGWAPAGPPSVGPVGSSSRFDGPPSTRPSSTLQGSRAHARRPRSATTPERCRRRSVTTSRRCAPPAPFDELKTILYPNSAGRSPSVTATRATGTRPCRSLPRPTRPPVPRPRRAQRRPLLVHGVRRPRSRTPVAGRPRWDPRT